MKDKLSIDYIKAKQFFEKIERDFNQGKGLFVNKNNLVENQVPTGVEKGSERHLLFLFYTCLNDHGVKSATMYEKAKKLYSENPEYFNPTWIVSNYDLSSCSELEILISKPIGARYPAMLAKSWYLNSVHILNEYDGDVIKLLKSSNNANTLLNKIKEFKGYGNKIGAMFLRAAIGLNVTNELEDIENVLVPVDIHDTRIMFLTEICCIEGKNINDIDYYLYKDEIQQMITDVCRMNHLNWLDVDRALWILGSTGCAKKKCDNCPVHKLCFHHMNYMY